MGGQLVQLPARGQLFLTKKQLAAHLGRSERWVEMRVRDGMPVEPANDRYGRRRYNLRLVEQWLRDGGPTRNKPRDRITMLEETVADLAAQVAELRRTG